MGDALQKAILYIVIGALIASGVFGYAFRNSNIQAQGAIDALRSQRDAAVGRVASLESELDTALSRVRDIEETNQRLRDLIDYLTESSGNLDAGLYSYREINRDFRDFIAEHGEAKDDT